MKTSRKILLLLAFIGTADFIIFFPWKIVIDDGSWVALLPGLFIIFFTYIFYHLLRIREEKNKAYFQNLVFRGSGDEADFKGIDLRQANLCGADLRKTDLSQVKLDEATYNEQTKFPKGFDPIAHGMKPVSE